MSRTLLRGIALLVGIIVVTNCASTYDVRAETDACTEARRSCAAECDTDACVAACSADDSTCLFTVEQENISTEGAADRQTTGLIKGLNLGLGVLLSAVVISSAIPYLSDTIAGISP